MVTNSATEANTGHLLPCGTKYTSCPWLPWWLPWWLSSWWRSAWAFAMAVPMVRGSRWSGRRVGAGMALARAEGGGQGVVLEEGVGQGDRLHPGRQAGIDDEPHRHLARLARGQR